MARRSDRAATRTLGRSGAWVLATLCLLTPSAAAAQTELSLRAGIHADRADRPDRYLGDADGRRMEAARGEATAFGVRLRHFLRPALGLELDAARSVNRSWQGSTTLPPPAFSNTTTYLSARAVLRANPAGTVQLQAAAGPALLVHGGTGTSYLARTTDPGGVVDVGARVRVGRWLAWEGGVTSYLYASRYAEAYQPPFVGQPVQPAGTAFRHDLVVTTGLALAWP